MEEKSDETKNNADNSLKSGAKNNSTSFPHIYSITIDETRNAASKSFVLIETASSEEHNLTVSLLKSKFPEASIFSSKDPEVNADGDSGDGEISDVSESNHYSVLDSRNSSKSKTDFVNKILKAYQSRSKANQDDELLKYRSSRLSPTNSTSMERQESKDSGFWSLTKSSFESMKSLSLNDSTPLNELTSKLFVTGHADTCSDKLQQLSKGKKWKKEHVLRYNSFSETKKCLSESSFEDTSSNADTVRDECSNRTTDSTDGFSRAGSLDNNDVEVEVKSSTGTSTPQKRRGKLIRDITIDDETSQVGQTSVSDNNQPKASECEKTANSTDCAKQTATNQSSNSSLSKRIVQCKSPPEKRASLFFYEKKMSIDEAPTFDSSQTQSKCFCIDCDQNQRPISSLYSPSSNHTHLLVKSTTNKPTNTNNNNNMPNQMMPNNGQKSNGFFGQSVSFDSFRTSYGLLTKPTNSNSMNPYLVRSYTSYDDDRYNSRHIPDPISNNLNGYQQQHSLSSGTKPPGKHITSPNMYNFHLNSNYSGLTAGQALLKPQSFGNRMCMSFNSKSSKLDGSSTYRSTSADRNCDPNLCCKTEPTVSRSAAALTTTTMSQQTDFHSTVVYNNNNNNNNNRGTQDSSLNTFESMQKSVFANDLLNVIGNLNKSEQNQSRQSNL
jgi:hypothetical protein